MATAKTAPKAETAAPEITTPDIVAPQIEQVKIETPEIEEVKIDTSLTQKGEKSIPGLFMS